MYSLQNLSELSSAIAANTSLSKLHYSAAGKYTTDATVLAILKGLQSNCTLTNLNFTHPYYFGLEATKAIGHFLESNNTLSYLSLEGISIDSEEGAAAISKGIRSNRSLTHLILSSNRIGDKESLVIVDGLKSNHTITHLGLQSNRFKLDGIKPLLELTNITYLSLRYMNLGEGGAIAIMRSLESNNTLASIDLSNTSIGDYGAAAIKYILQSNNTLTFLNLESNNIGVHGGLNIAQSLHSNTSLTHLDLSYNKIVDGGIISLSNALRMNNTLTKLRLDSSTYGMFQSNYSCCYHIVSFFISKVSLDTFKHMIVSLSLNSSLTSLVLPPPTGLFTFLQHKSHK